ncbi:hypothetical protein K439DRAFT_830049 [Ramaria rubella]|nr:hypothetical protein K439DRAFT_830049 [Ramaria rubella]
MRPHLACFSLPSHSAATTIIGHSSDTADLLSHPTDISPHQWSCAVFNTPSPLIPSYSSLPTPESTSARQWLRLIWGTHVAPVATLQLYARD